MNRSFYVSVAFLTLAGYALAQVPAPAPAPPPPNTRNAAQGPGRGGFATRRFLVLRPPPGVAPAAPGVQK